MSEISTHHTDNSELLFSYMKRDILGEDSKQYTEDILNSNISAEDIVTLFDMLFSQNFDIEKIKFSSNKLFNLVHKSLQSSYENNDFTQYKTISYLIEDNNKIKELLNTLKIEILTFNKNEDNQDTLLTLLQVLQNIDNHYTVKENVIFPFIEKSWEEFACLKLMWSYHDDVRNTIKSLIHKLQNGIERKDFNALIGKIFFDINTVIFREESVLYYLLAKKSSYEEINSLLQEVKELGLSFVTIEETDFESTTPKEQIDDIITLSTGALSIEQLELLFKYITVDVTFVDEHDEVQFYSNPPHRVFPRSNAIIGRKVQNCHPHESVEIVEKILAAFKNKEKSKAQFWINFRDKFVVIQYFAMYDENGIYKGTLEVSQEASEIKDLQGERRLLDWE